MTEKHAFRSIPTSMYCIDCAGDEEDHNLHFTAEEVQQKEKYKEDIKSIPDYGKQYQIDHDGFKGTVIGHYITREGKYGTVLQLNDARVVHVYGTKWLIPSV